MLKTSLTSILRWALITLLVIGHHIIQGLAIKTINNPRSTDPRSTDPLLLKLYPNPSNPTSLDPRYLHWISQFRSATNFRHEISTHIQSRFLNIKFYIPLLSIFRKIIWLNPLRKARESYVCVNLLRKRIILIKYYFDTFQNKIMFTETKIL